MKLKFLISSLVCALTGYALASSLDSTALASETPTINQVNFATGNLPEPPQQHRPWKPPATDLPTNLISATKILFNLGLADPRGGDYREFEMVTGDVWGETKESKVHGWVLPTRAGQQQRFAVSWNGMVYPAISVGAKADLKQDVEVLLQAQETWRLEALTNRFAELIGPWEYELSPEYFSVSQTNLTAVKIMLLLRLGEGRLARDYWNRQQAIQPLNERKEDARDPFRQLANGWAWSLFDRAVCAHMRGDDALSLADCRQLAQAWPELEREVERRGFSHRLSLDVNQKHAGAPTMSYFDFLKPLPELLADEERRAKEPPRETVLQLGLAKFPDKSKRIAALILDLEDVAERQWGQPGGVSFNVNPTVEALIAEGDDAVDPLLNCMENDHRLTRSVSFWRDFKTERNLLSVQEAAQAALSAILMVDFKTAAEYRAYWQKYKSVAQPERWYLTLLDDEAGRQQWMQAAVEILSRTDGRTAYLWKNAPIPNATNGYRYVAESLRSRADPSVADLFLKRALAIAPTNFTSSDDCGTFADAADLGLMLAEWDPKAAKDALGKIIQRCPALYADAPGRWGTGCAVVPEQFAGLAVALAKLGDTSGLDLYSKWLGHQNFEDIADALPGVLTPLWRFPDQPSIKDVSARIFQMQKVDWMSEWVGTDLLHTHLVQNEAFRRLILQALTDKSKAGTFVRLADGQYRINTPGIQRGSVFDPDAFAPKVGEVVSFRVCDDIADRLSRIEDLPQFKIYWPEAMRDAAIANIIRFLNQNGDQLKLRSAVWPVDED